MKRKDEKIMKKLISLTLVLVLIVACLSGISFAADPIATITNGSTSVDVNTVDEIIAALDPSGKTVITLKSDITAPRANLTVSCTIDLNGHTWTGTEGNGISVAKAGTENAITVVKNGTIIGNIVGLRVSGGALQMDGVTVRGGGSSAGVGYYETSPQYNDLNKITNCTLVGINAGAFSFLHQTEKQSGVKMFIENTVLVNSKEAGAYVFTAKNGDGTVVLGKGVNMYCYKTDAFADKTNIEGEATTAEFNPATVEIEKLDMKLAGLTYWHTAEYVAPVQPEAPAAPATPTTPAAPTGPATPTPDVTVPSTGVSVAALGIMAVVSLAGAVITKKN